MRVVAADTDLCPVDLGAYSSRVTFMVGNAAIDAAASCASSVVQAVAEEWEVDPARVRSDGRRGFDLEDDSRRMTSREAFQLAEARFDTLGSTALTTRRSSAATTAAARSAPRPPTRSRPTSSRSRVDTETGRITFDKVWCAHDCGRALNPMLVAGQIEGSVYMGIAEALLEDHEVNRFGLHAGPSLLDYRIPTSLDTPDIEAFIVESIDPEGPYGAKEAGEGPLHSVDPGARATRSSTRSASA